MLKLQKMKNEKTIENLSYKKVFNKIYVNFL